MKTTLRGFGITFCTASAVIALTGCDAEPHAGAGGDSSQSAQSGSGALSYEAIRELIGNPDDFARARELGTLLPTLGPGSIPAARAALEDADKLQMTAVEFELLVRYWALHEPDEASAYALGRSPLAFRVPAVFAAVTLWATAEPQNALQAVRPWSIEGGDTGWAAEIALVRGWYSSGKPGLEQYIHDLGSGVQRQRALSAYAVAVIRKHGADAIAKWAEALPADTENENYKLEAFRRVAEAMVPFDLAAAKKFCDAHCEGPEGSNMRKVIAGRWVLDEPGAAMEWLATSPEGKERQFAVRVTYATWANRDPDSAVAWMRENVAGDPPPAWLQPAIPVYARFLGKKAPLEGLAWAEKLEPDERYWATIDIARHWRRHDEAAAEAWIRHASLVPDQLERIRAPETPLERREREEAAKRAERVKAAAAAS